MNQKIIALQQDLSLKTSGISSTIISVSKKVLARVVACVCAQREQALPESNKVYTNKLQKTQLELIKSEQTLKEIERIAKIGHWELDLVNNILIWSDQVYEIFGVSPKQVDSSYDFFLSLVHPDDRDLTAQAYEKALANKEEYSFQHRVLLSNDEVVYVHERGGTEYDADDKPLRTIGTVQDITDFKQLEERNVHENKMQAIGTLTAGLVHYFNQMLSVIIGYSELSMIDGKHETEIERAKLINKTGQRFNKIVRQLMVFIKQVPTKIIKIDPYIQVKDASTLLRASLPSTVRLENNLERNLGFVEAEDGMFNQIIMALGVNARDAIGDKGEGKITIDLKQDSKMIILVFNDNGVGIDKPNLKRVFDPFYTTKPYTEEHTGLSLSVVKGLVDKCNGTISITSVENQGTTVTISLPKIEDTEVLTSTVDKKPFSFESLNVLYVDDDATLVEMATELLPKLGFKSVEAIGDSLEALKTIKADPNRFDLVISDIVMPKLTGLELSREIKKLRPDLKVLFVSGHSGGAFEQELDSGVKDLILRKPFTRKEVQKFVEKVFQNSSFM
jgi:PAS domain S-box-containing protein